MAEAQTTYKCDFCGMAFPDLDDCLAHERRHISPDDVLVVAAAYYQDHLNPYPRALMVRLPYPTGGETFRQYTLTGKEHVPWTESALYPFAGFPVYYRAWPNR